MKKLISTLLLLGSINAVADNNYDFREQTELHCQSTLDSKINFEAVIQNETKNGFSGYPTSNTSTVKLNLKGKFDGKNINVSKKIGFTIESKERLANKGTYSLKNNEGAVTAVALSDLTEDETTPGISTKISIKNLFSSIFGQSTAHANIVHGAGSGFVSLSIEDEHFETIPVVCTNKRDSADRGQEYIVDFQ